MGYLVGMYAIYGVAAIGLTIWLAQTLYRNGAVFLEEVFEDRPGVAQAVNRLLVTGFYMLNLGYAFLLLRSDVEPNALAAVEALVEKLGVLLVSLGVVHFLNMYVFFRIRRRIESTTLALPVAPQYAVPPVQPAWGQAQP